MEHFYKHNTNRVTSKMLVARILIAIFICCGTAHSCLSGWLTHGSKCYHFSHDKEEWVNAVTVCQILGGHLVEIDDVSENNYIVSQAKLGNKSYWIGLNDLQEENTWVWVNNNKHATYTYWYTNQPDNSRNNENCALIAQPYGYLWNDASCSLSLNYICESEAE